MPATMATMAPLSIIQPQYKNVRDDSGSRTDTRSTNEAPQTVQAEMAGDLNPTALGKKMVPYFAH